MTAEPLRLVLVNAPPKDPIVTVDEAIAHCKIDESDDSNLVNGLIATATELAEAHTGRALLTQTWKMFLDAWPSCGFVELPKAPLQSVTHIKTYDDADVATTFAAADYFVDAVSKPGRIVVRSGASRPSPTRVANGVEIQFACGYGPEPKDVPSRIRSGILNLVAFLYEHRGDAAIEVPEQIYAQLDDGVGERSAWPA